MQLSFASPRGLAPSSWFGWRRLQGPTAIEKEDALSGKIHEPTHARLTLCVEGLGKSLGTCMVATWASAGADSGRPVVRVKPTNGIIVCDACLSTKFVKQSAGLTAPTIVESVRLPDRNRPWIQRSAQERWRTSPSPRRLQIPMAAVASDRRLTASSRPRSLATL